MTDLQKQIVQGSVKELALLDGNAIDVIAREASVNQMAVYEFFISYHELVFKKMMALEGEK